MKGITLKQFIEDVEKSIVPYARENSEGSYEAAMTKVKNAFGKIPLTENQVRTIVNRVWNRMYAQPVIACWGICNTASLNAYSVNEEEVVAGINNSEPETFNVQSDLDGEFFIDFHGSHYYLNERMRV